MTTNQKVVGSNPSWYTSKKAAYRRLFCWPAKRGTGTYLLRSNNGGAFSRPRSGRYPDWYGRGAGTHLVRSNNGGAFSRPRSGRYPDWYGRCAGTHLVRSNNGGPLADCEAGGIPTGTGGVLEPICCEATMGTGAEAPPAEDKARRRF